MNSNEPNDEPDGDGTAMLQPPTMRAPALTLGQCEARRLDQSRQDCYYATSSRISQADLGIRFDSPLRDLERLASNQPRPVWPNGAPFAVCLTHDVDNVAWLSPRMHARRLRSQLRFLLRNRPERRALGALKSTLGTWTSAWMSGPQKDPLHCYEQWLAIEAEFDAKSTFLFLPETYDRPHFSDGGYRYSDTIRFDDRLCSVAEMIQQIHQRGWEVGLHPSWYSYCCSRTVRRDKERLEAIVKAPIVSARQHFLHFDIRCTPRVYQEAGLLYDSSLGFNDDVGFRTGSCWPFELTDFQQESLTDVIELPLIIQDKCLTKIIGQGSVDRALEHGLQVADRVAAVGGVLTLLWHPRLVNDRLSMEVYRGLLQRLHERGAWMSTMADLGGWWKRERRQWT